MEAFLWQVVIAKEAVATVGVNGPGYPVTGTNGIPLEILDWHGRVHGNDPSNDFMSKDGWSCDLTPTFKGVNVTAAYGALHDPYQDLPLFGRFPAGMNVSQWASRSIIQGHAAFLEG